MEENFIRRYENVLDERLLEVLSNMYDNVLIWDDSWNSRNDKHRKDNQYALQMDPVNDLIVQHISENLVSRMFAPYVREFPYLSNVEEWCSANTLLQKTEPTEGYHTFHCENSRWTTQNRYIAWMVYLNDVEEGGETEFLYQKCKFKPKTNVGLIWPGSYTHLHRGNPPMSTKYILTGWFTPVDGMIRFGTKQPKLDWRK